MNDYFVLSKDKIVAEYIGGQIKILDNELVPLYLKNRGFEQWVEKRAIDSTRPNSRLLKRMLRLTKKDDFNTALQVNAATITDTYWVKPVSSNLEYEDIIFNDDKWYAVALKGSKDGFDFNPGRTPELTNTGSYEKGWKYENGSWYLHKKTDKNALFSELFFYKLGKYLGYDMAEYEKVSDTEIKSKDFTNHAHVNFEDVSGFLAEDCDTDFMGTYLALRKIKPGLEKDYAKMLYMDAICYNPDRHWENFGILRDPKTGEILSFAPMFDHNMALIADGEVRNEPIKGFLKDYIEFFESPVVVFDVPQLTKDNLSNIIDSIDVDISEQTKQDVTEFVYKGHELIKAAREKAGHKENTKHESRVSSKERCR